jgi:hypothetical protein
MVQHTIFVDYYRIDNYTYFDNSAKPQQSSSSLNISQIGGEATANYKRFHLNGRVLFQKVLSNQDFCLFLILSEELTFLSSSGIQKSSHYPDRNQNCIISQNLHPETILLC